MVEISYPIKRIHIVYEVYYRCDSCEEGNMVFDRAGIIAHPPVFPHTCDICKNRSNLDQIYPHISYGS